MNGVRLLITMLLAAASLNAEAAELKPETIAAWDRYTAELAARVQRGGLRSECGERLDVPSGAIHHWCGKTLVRGVTLDDLLDGLLNPGTPPPQDDVVASRVVSRRGDALRVYLRLVRKTIVTVTYDTEHDVVFTRALPTQATSTSVATRIRQVGGGDQGFLWRMNSYWRYRQVADGVLVELESVTLSRDLPMLLRPIAAPIISRVARDSVSRTLDAVRRHFEAAAAVGSGPLLDRRGLGEGG